MSRSAKSLRIAIAVVVFAATAVAGASAALVKVGDLVLRADGGFQPNALPRTAFAPIDFQGHADITAQSGRALPVLQQIALDFDRDGRLSTSGLPVCTPDRVAEATPREAERRCRGAIVGEGRVGVLVSIPGLSQMRMTSPLTIFNGPRVDGPTVVLHAQITAPAAQTFAIVVPIERRSGPYGYRATIELPPIAGGYGALTHIDAKIGRRYTFQGKRRSYTSARCSDGALQTHGRFTFGDGTIIDGSVEKPCSVLSGP
jgi:hypothetical protein